MTFHQHKSTHFSTHCPIFPLKSHKFAQTYVDYADFLFFPRADQRGLFIFLETWHPNEKRGLVPGVLGAKPLEYKA